MAEDGIRRKDGEKAAFTLLFNNGDSVRQALAEDTANQLAKLGIEVTAEGVGWDTAYDRAQSDPMIWGWGAHTPMELYNIYHTMEMQDGTVLSLCKCIGRFVYGSGACRIFGDGILMNYGKSTSDGTTGITQEGDIPWIWLCNIDHLYFVRDGLQVAEQKIHPHGHGWSIVNNVDQWSWNVEN